MLKISKSGVSRRTPSLFENSITGCLCKHGLSSQKPLLSTDSSSLIDIKSNTIPLDKKNVLSKMGELIISEDYKDMLKRTLKKPIRLIDKQSVLREIVFGADNIYHLYYLIDNYHNEFTHHSLLYFIKKLKMMVPNNITELGLPLEVKSHLTKLLIKWSPNFEADECLSTFCNLDSLGFNIDDMAYHASMQILKFHLNHFVLDDLIRIKKALRKLKGEEKQFSNEYVENLEKALHLAVQIKLSDLDSISTANNLIKHFSNDLSNSNMQKIRKYIEDYRHYYGRNQYKNMKAQPVED